MILRYLLSGLVGLAGAAAISRAALAIYRTWIRQALFADPVATFFFVAFLILSLLEVPLMLAALRRLAREQGSGWAPLALNLVFVLTAGIYGSFYLLLTGRTTEAFFLSGLSLLRLAASLLLGRSA